VTIFCVDVHFLSYFHHKSIVLSTVLCWNSAHYESDEMCAQEMTSTHVTFLGRYQCIY